MPVIETRHFKYVTEEGLDADLAVKLEVNKAGLFLATVPLVFMDTIGALIKESASADSHHKLRSQVSFTVTTAGNIRLYARQLEWVAELISAALYDYSKPDVKSEIVIRYAVQAHCNTWELPDGRLTCNGSVAQAIMEEEGSIPRNGSSAVRNDSASPYGYWAKECDHSTYDGHYPPGFSLLLYAGVRIKTTTTRGTFVKTSYAGTGRNTFGSLAPMDLLDSVLATEPKEHSDIKINDMSYSDEAALFFYNTLMAMATLSLKLARFFADDQHLAAAIAAQSLPELSLHAE